MPGASAAFSLPVAITGATGFVGRHVLARLAGAQTDPAGVVRALTRRPVEAAAAGPLTWVPGHLGDDGALRRLVEGCRLVIHIAGATKALDAAGFMAANAEGTRRLMRAVAEAADPACRVIHVSSLAAREPDLSPYAASKRAGEEAVAGMLPPARRIILRPPALYGPQDRELLPLLLATRRGFLPVPGPRGQRLALLHVADLVEAIARLADDAVFEALAGRRLEIDDGHGGYSPEEMAAALSAVWGRPVRPVPIPAPVTTAAAHLAQAWARLTGRPAMLTPHKLPELRHLDWSVEMDAGLLRHWRPRFDLESGLRAVLADSPGRSAA